ncbi:MAG: hypothetical protein RL207_1176, partial [Bacteroidota bacterium]
FAPELNDSLAQLVEQYTFNVWALGSNPRGITNKSPLRKKWTFVVLIAFEIHFNKRRKQKKSRLCNAKWTFVWNEPHYGNTRKRNPSAFK